MIKKEVKLRYIIRCNMKDVIYILCSKKMFDDLKIKYYIKKK